MKKATSRPVIQVAKGPALFVKIASPGIMASSGRDASSGQSLVREFARKKSRESIALSGRRSGYMAKCFWSETVIQGRIFLNNIMKI